MKLARAATKSHFCKHSTPSIRKLARLTLLRVHQGVHLSLWMHRNASLHHSYSQDLLGAAEASEDARGAKFSTPHLSEYSS
jgi:hypothetical protein